MADQIISPAGGIGRHTGFKTRRSKEHQSSTLWWATKIKEVELMFELQTLNYDQQELLENTISSNAFYMIVGGALVSRKSLSVVRMGDGEVYLYNEAENGPIVPKALKGDHSEEWLKRLGVWNIPENILHNRLLMAAEECTYFAPSISGIWNPGYNNYGLSYRDKYVDNFFVNDWSMDMKFALYKEAKHILLICGKTETADALQIRLKNRFKVKVTYLKLTSWEGTEDVITLASEVDAPLVLFSAGPAGKYIGPKIAANNKVVLDIGNTIDYWIPEYTKNDNR